MGTSSDSAGNYILSDVPEGLYTVIVSCIGYDLILEKISFSGGTSVEVDFQLSPKVYQLETVIIEEDEDEEWRDNLEIFFREFIGTSQNSQKCSIVDPYIINLIRDEDDILLASADEPIEIINESLGYKIYYFLESFCYDGSSTKFKGYPVFEPLISNSTSINEIWVENRLKTYCGSIRHFLYAASRDFDSFSPHFTGTKNLNEQSVLNREGFRIWLNENTDSQFNINKHRRLIQTPEYIFNTSITNEKLLSFEGTICIVYDRKKEDDSFLDYLNANRHVKNPTSYIQLHSTAVQFDEKGRYYDEFQIQTFGYWSYERVADMLPFDYEISERVLKIIQFK